MKFDSIYWSIPKQAISIQIIFHIKDGTQTQSHFCEERKNGEKQKKQLFASSNLPATCLLSMNQKPTKLKEGFN